MTWTVVGLVTDNDGLSLNETTRSTPAANVRRVQGRRIPVDREHDGVEVGEVIHLEMAYRGLYAVCQVECAPTVPVLVAGEVVEVEDWPMYFSALRRSRGPDQDIELLAISLTVDPATVGHRAHGPVEWYEGTISRRSGWHMRGLSKQLITHAGETALTRHGRPLRVHTYRDLLPVMQRTDDRGDSPPAGAGWVDDRGRRVAGPGMRYGPPSPVLSVGGRVPRRAA